MKDKVSAFVSMLKIGSVLVTMFFGIFYFGGQFKEIQMEIKGSKKNISLLTQEIKGGNKEILSFLKEQNEKMHKIDKQVGENRIVIEVLRNAK